MKYLIILTLTLIQWSPLSAFADISVDGTPAIHFTGYKFTEKAAVSGTFKEANWMYKKSASDIKSLLMGAKVRIDSFSIDAGNPARNTNITTALFKNWGGRYMNLEVTEVDEENGFLKAELEIGDTKKDLFFQFTNVKNIVTFTGSIDLLQIGFASAFKKLAAQCADLHKGKDGQVKTWSTIDLKVTANIK